MSPKLVSCRPVVLGLPGLALTDADRQALRDIRPAGVILFARNIASVAQVSALCSELQTYLPAVGQDGHALIAVDQEGGRVQRLLFNGRQPAAKTFGDLFKTNPAAALRAARLNALLLAADLREVGATWAMAPVVDIAYPETHAIIGDRAFSATPQAVAMLAQVSVLGLADGGCHSCPKHAPGHGRAAADSHVELPVVHASADEMFETDWLPYRMMGATVPFVMTAHVALPEIQGRTDLPATYDRGLLDALREQWGFEGLWVADDLGMQALPGDYAARLGWALLDDDNTAASGGCDLALCCFSKLVHGMAGTVFDAENFAVFMAALGQIPPLGERAERVLIGLTLAPAVTAEKVAAARAELATLLVG